MARYVGSETEVRRVSRNGVMYEFIRYTEPSFNAMGHVYGTVTEFTARRWNGVQWVNLHRFYVKGE